MGSAGSGLSPSGDGRGIKGLIGWINQRGYVTIGELCSVLEWPGDAERILEVVTQLNHMGIEIVEDEPGHASDADDQDFERHFQRRAVRMLASLTDRERRALKMRFGMEAEKGAPPEDVEQRFRTIMDRIHAIEKKALRRLDRKRSRDRDGSKGQES